jgi:sugar phosphate isomerase/epimerase
VRSLGPDALVLCSGTVRDAGLVATVRAAAAAGFQGVSLYEREVRRARAEGWSDEDLCALLDGEGIAVAELDGVLRWLPDDARGPTTEEFVATAAALGARSITVLEVDGRRVGDELPLDAVCEAFALVCDRAADAGLLAHIEYFPTSGIPDFATAAAVALGAGRANGGVMCDVWHHVRGPDRGALDFTGAPVLAMQVSDVAPVANADLVTEMMQGRLLPGEGVADLAGLLGALRSAGCRAPIEVEVYSDALAAVPPVEAARRARAAIGRVLDTNDDVEGCG